MQDACLDPCMFKLDDRLLALCNTWHSKWRSNKRHYSLRAHSESGSVYNRDASLSRLAACSGLIVVFGTLIRRSLLAPCRLYRILSACLLRPSLLRHAEEPVEPDGASHIEHNVDPHNPKVSPPEIRVTLSRQLSHHSRVRVLQPKEPEELVRRSVRTVRAAVRARAV